MKLHDPEQEYRRQLLADAREGKANAKVELQTEYHVRVYTTAERKKLYKHKNARRSQNNS